MAGTSLLALIDDIATLLDDISVMTKVAAKKTAGVLGDDLALNAEQVSGAPANRELAVVLQVAKGSFVNKGILVPSAILISAVYPPLVMILLMLGGAYLCYEGFEKIAEKVFHAKTDGAGALEAPPLDPLAFEKLRVRGAIRTDFILSAEIIVISLGTMAGRPLQSQIGSLVAIAIVMTIGVYGLVLGIVKLDDLGLFLLGRPSRASQSVGRVLVNAAPPLMRLLGVLGTIAMFLVGGGILIHAVPVLEDIAHRAQELHGALGAAFPFFAGACVGAILVGLMALVRLVLRRTSPGPGA